MKKTLLITLEYPPHVGGVATYTHDLALALDPMQTVVLAPKHSDAASWDSRQPYTIIRKPFFFPRCVWPRWMRLLWQTWRIVRRHQIERIMVHHALPVGYVAWCLKKWVKIPYLVFSHGTDVLAASQSSWKRSRMIQVCQDAEQVIFNSESLKRRYLEVFPQFEDRTTVMYPCPDPSFFTPPDQQVLEDLRNTYALHGKKVMLTIARFVDGKGFPHLLRMIPELLKHEPHLVWMLIGDGPKKEYILSEVQKRNLQNIVRYIGDVPHTEIRKFYYLADVFVLLTHPDEGREEGLGLVFLEAAAAGVPTVAGKSGGVEEAVLHAKTGLVVDVYAGDPSIVQTISELLSNPSYASTLGTHAQQRMRSEFIWSHQVRILDPWLSDGKESSNVHPV